MVKSGSFKVSQGSTAGRVGAGLGKGLAEALPKEVQQYRLQQGLKQFAEQAPGMNPLQAFAQAAGIPGVTPQMIQALPEIVKQQQYAREFSNKANEAPPAFPSQPNLTETIENQGLTTRRPVEETLNPPIPRSYPEILSAASQNYNANPQFYKNDPQNAIAEQEKIEAFNQERNKAFQNKRLLEQGVQSNVKSSLANRAKTYNVQIPGNVYQDIENEALRSVLPKDQGGEGYTEEQSANVYGKILDEVSREYQSLKDLGNWSILTQSPKEINRTLTSLQKDFKSRNDQRNMADLLIGQNGFSPGKAYNLAFPISDYKELNAEMSKLPKLSEPLSFKKGYAEIPKSLKDPVQATNSIVQKLAENLGNGSPLSVAYELDRLGYDAGIWLRYLDNNKEKYDLTKRQSDELKRTRGVIRNLNDQWIETFSQ